MKRWSYVPIVGVILVGVYIGLHHQHIPISYDKNYVDELGDLKDYDLTLVATYEIDSPPVTLYHFNGWNDPGDFFKIQIKLTHHKVFEFENDSGWLKLPELNQNFYGTVINWLKLPEGSKKLEVYPYFIKLSMEEGACILMFVGWGDGSEQELLTLIYVNQDKAEVIFNKRVGLVEIAETDKGGYRLVGRLGISEYGVDPCEILIEDQKLSFRPLPFEQVYESQSLPIVLYDCIGWGHNKQPGDFMRVAVGEEPGQVFDNFSGFWCKMGRPIRIPEKSEHIKRHPYFISLELGEGLGHILVLSQCDYHGKAFPWMDLVRVLPPSKGYICVWSMPSIRFTIKEIIEIEGSYRLIGTTVSKEGKEEYCEAVIENGEIVH